MKRIILAGALALAGVSIAACGPVPADPPPTVPASAWRVSLTADLSLTPAPADPVEVVCLSLDCAP